MWQSPGWLLVVPLVGAIVVTMAPGRQARWIALVASTVTFAYSVILAALFTHWNDGGFGWESSIPWRGAWGCRKPCALLSEARPPAGP